MPSCSAYGCTNRPDNKSKKQVLNEASGGKITFHRFPKNTALRSEWITAVRRQNWEPSVKSNLCSQHFSEECFDRSSLCVVRLRENAVPTIFPTYPVHLQKTIKKRKSPKQRVVKKTSPIASLSTIESKTPERLPLPIPLTATQSPQPSTSTLSPIYPGIYQLKRNLVTRSTSVSPAKKRQMCSSPTTKLITTHYEGKVLTLKRKIKNLQRAKERHVKKIASLKNVLTELQRKKLLSEDQVELLENIPGPNKTILKRQLAKSKNQPMNRKYEAELRSFALTLHYYSPVAYNYVRKTFNTCLPHPKTLFKWYQVVEGNPGFTTEAFQAIQIRSEHENTPILCSLMFDEMAIRRHLQYNGKKYYGTVDLGDDVNNDEQTLAKDALVFLLVAINSSWKVPVAYFLIDGINASQKRHLVLSCIKMATDYGVQVVSLTFDGTTTNMAMAKSLGCSLDPFSKMRTYFEHPEPEVKQRIYLFPDPCHMLKLIRNCLGELKSFVWDNEFIQWKYIEKLHELQESEGLHLGNKVRTQHINFFKQKMKVRFAAQVFSSSVADALEFCNKQLQLPAFKGCEKTIEFIRHINNLFDILNSKYLRQIGFKKPINSQNYENIINALSACQELLKNIKCSKNGPSILVSRRKTGFLGFLILIESLTLMYAELVEEKKLLKFIPTYKMSQDHLELMFGSIRRHGGLNNNPTVLQFRAAYRKILVHTQLQETTTGNCIPLEHISILHCSSATTTPVEVLNNSVEKGSLLDDVSEEIIHDHNYVGTVTDISIISEHIITYIAGYVIRHLCKVVKCGDCIAALFSNDVNNYSYGLINQKTRGGF